MIFSREPMCASAQMAACASTKLNGMNTNQPRVLRKLLIADPIVEHSTRLALTTELDLRACAELRISSEHPDHPIEHLFDGSAGEGASRWIAGRADKPGTILLVFDDPTDIAQCAFEAEERELARTQQVIAEYLVATGDTYRQCFIQEFNFSPRGATYQRELIELNLRAVRRLRFTVLADKSGCGTASLTALRLYSPT
jgi:hypothetical protein